MTSSQSKASLRFFKMPTTSEGKLVRGAVGPLRNSTAAAGDVPMCMWLGDDGLVGHPAALPHRPICVLECT